MKSNPSVRRGLLALALGAVVLPTSADDDCDAPVERWQSREAVRQLADRQGWQIQRLKIDDGCYELRGTDAQGRGFKAKVDPETLKVLKFKLKDGQRAREQDRDRDRDHDLDRDRDRDREGDREHAIPAPPSTAGSAPPSPTH